MPRIPCSSPTSTAKSCRSTTSSQLLGFRPDELIEQSLSRFISPQETREFTAALREVVECGVSRDAQLNPHTASGEVIPTRLNASALRDANRRVIGAA
ncbi:MAG TPA: PAS domain-containing protein [Methylomirabilota bacterium]|nr:PAS domain-containing protein [Methylomirabilota bacterium]